MEQKSIKEVLTNFLERSKQDDFDLIRIDMEKIHAPSTKMRVGYWAQATEYLYLYRVRQGILDAVLAPEFFFRGKGSENKNPLPPLPDFLSATYASQNTYLYRVRQDNNIGANGVSRSGRTGGGSCQYVSHSI
jgi:hypothetical protein